MKNEFSINEGDISTQREQEISDLVDEIIGDNSNAEYKMLNKALESARNIKEAIITALAFGYVSGLNAGKELYQSTIPDEFDEALPTCVMCGDVISPPIFDLSNLDFSRVSAERIAQLNDKGDEILHELLTKTDAATISNTYIIKRMVQSAINIEEALLVAAASGAMITSVKQFKNE